MIFLYEIIPCILLGLYPIFNNDTISLINLLIIPVYMLFANCKLVKFNSIHKRFSCYLWMIFLVATGHILEYYFWGVRTGGLLNPDSETLLIMSYKFKFAICIVSSIWYFWFGINRKTIINTGIVLGVMNLISLLVTFFLYHVPFLSDFFSASWIMLIASLSICVYGIAIGKSLNNFAVRTNLLINSLNCFIILARCVC